MNLVAVGLARHVFKLLSGVILFVFALSGNASAEVIVNAVKRVTWVITEPDESTHGHYSSSLADLALSISPPLIDAHSCPGTGCSAPPDGAWFVLAGLPATNINIPDATVPGATGAASIGFEVPPPSVNVEGQTVVTGSISAFAYADASFPPGLLGFGTSSGSLNVLSGTISGLAIKQDDTPFTTVPITNISEACLKGNTCSGNASDPIGVRYIDLTSGTSLSQDLLSIDEHANFNGGLSWDSNGISLTAPLDGSSSASISLDVLSSWVSDPSLVDSTITLANGVFQKSGIFVNLPWVVTGTSAMLPGGILDLITVPFQVPDPLLNNNDLYQPELLLDQTATAIEAVPEPSSVSIIAGIFTLFLLYIAQHKKSAQRWSFRAGLQALILCSRALR